MSDISYHPSWQNQFFERVDRLPIPNLAVYGLILLGLVLLSHLMPWAEGKLAWGAIDPYQFNFLVWFLVVFIGEDYLLATSRSALIRFRPALDVAQEEFDQIVFRFTQVPARTGWLITVIGVLFPFLMVSYAAPYQRSGLSLAVFLASGAFLISLVFFLFYHIVQALRMTVRLYARVERINIFHLEPLYAFSVLSSRIGVFFVITSTLAYLTNIAFSRTPQVGGFLFFASINLIIAVLAFLLPLGGIHRRLVGVKELASRENDRRLDEAYNELHDRADRRDLEGMVEFHHAIQALMEFRTELKSVSTWPWSPGTLRNFITALLLPIVLWGLQQVISRYL
jgi:hypothetical protein